MLVHRRVTPSIKFAGTHLYTWVERGTVRVKCLAQEHNTMSPARARTRSARSGVGRTNHEATAPLTYAHLHLILLTYMHRLHVVDQKDRSRTCNVSDRILPTLFHSGNAGLSRKSRYTLFFVRKSNCQTEAEQTFFLAACTSKAREGTLR